MATLDEVAAMASALPEVTEGVRFNHRTWSVDGKAFLWERPFSKADLKRFGTDPVPDGPIVAVSTEDLAEKEAILSAGTPGVFTISHFDGYKAYLVQLSEVPAKALEEAILDGWLACAPRAMAVQHLKVIGRGDAL